MTYEGLNLACPACGHTRNVDTELEPRVGDGTICIKCGAVLTFTADGLRAATADEMALADQHPAVQRVRALLNLRKLAESIRGTIGEVPDVPPPPGVQLHAVEVELEHDEDGNVRVVNAGDDLPDEVRGMVETMLETMRRQQQVDDVAENVTQEVANHVLAVFGDDEASWPSVAITELIALIRTCKESNEELLDHLDHCGLVHGYILAVNLAVDLGQDGMSMLRVLGGLDPVPTGERVDTEVRA